jgi:hypothetical protein
MRVSSRLGLSYQRASQALTVSQIRVNVGTDRAVGRPGRLEKCGQRDTWMAGITWYDWEDKTRAHVDQLMARRK